MRKNEQLVRIIGNAGLPSADRRLLLGLIEKRLKPVMSKFQIIENDVTILHHIGVKYAERGIFVPEQILREPRSQLLIEIKRLESRLILELCLLTIAGLIPPIAML